VRIGLVVLAVVVLTGCSGPTGAPATPQASPTAGEATAEAALTGIVRAINDADDAAVHRLVCAAGRHDALSFQESWAELVEVDPDLNSLRYHAEAGPIESRAADRVVASVTVTVTGLPAHLSVEEEQALSSSQAPVPLNMIGVGHELYLVREGGGWVACGPLGIQS
jgi:hypothetical protein